MVDYYVQGADGRALLREDMPPKNGSKVSMHIVA